MWQSASPGGSSSAASQEIRCILKSRPLVPVQTPSKSEALCDIS
jgi:hypothetical protein